MSVSILLVVGSLALFILEVFFVSFGALAIAAVSLGILGLITAFGVSPAFGWIMSGALFVGIPCCLRMAFVILPKLPFARGFYLKAPDLSEDDRHAGARIDPALLGREGVTTSPLRPAGNAAFGEDVLQVVSDGVMIGPGTPVKVIEVTGNRIVVEPAGSELKEEN